MVLFSISATLPGDAAGFLTNVTAIDVSDSGVTPMVYLATAQGGGLSAYRIDSTGALSLQATHAYSDAMHPLAATSLLTVDVAGKSLLLPIGPSDTHETAYGLGADGSLLSSLPTTLSAATALPQESCGTVAVIVGSATYLYSANVGSSAVSGYAIASPTTLVALAPPVAIGAPADGAITALGEVNSGGGHWLLAGMSGDNRVLSYAVGPSGGLTYVGTVGQETGLSITGPSAVASATVGADNYAIVASAGNSSLSVLHVGTDGKLVATDQVVDDLNTRFGGADHLATVASGGHEFVLAAGADDGISLFTLLPGGLLFLLDTIAETAATTLNNVSALAATAQGGNLQVFAASASEPGLTELTVNLTHFGSILEGGNGGTVVTGTAKDDILIAHDGHDQLFGGAGADTFVFDPAGASSDGKLGTVMDFQVGIDKLDLSYLPILHDASALTITQTATGADLHFNGYWVEVDGKVPGPISAASFTTDVVLNVTHQAVGLTDAYGFVANTLPSTPPGETLIGKAGADVLSGDLGPDNLSGMAGNDVINGLGGNDTIDGGAGSDTLGGGDGNDLIYGGHAIGDLGDSIDAGAGNDTVDAGVGNNTVFGGDGNDLLSAGNGNNLVDGGAGADTINSGNVSDTLFGGDGNDSILGGTTTADLRDVIYGGTGNDSIDGGYGNDQISGDAGDDSIIGNFGSDTLIGNAGNDTLSGGPLSDMLYGGPGNDFLNGGFGSDRLSGGPGADQFFHLGTQSHGSDWIQDYNAADGDILVFGNSSATANQFQVNHAETPHAGVAGVAEAFVIYKPTGQIIWALVDGAAQQHIELQIAGSTTLHDLG